MKIEHRRITAQRSNHRGKRHKLSFSGKDHLKILLVPSGTDTEPGSTGPQAVNSKVCLLQLHLYLKPTQLERLT